MTAPSIVIQFKVDVGRHNLWFVFQQVEPDGCWVALGRGRLTREEAEDYLRRLIIA